jgi:uncharacterized protein YutE (UPF0331/DUF86 family)
MAGSTEFDLVKIGKVISDIKKYYADFEKLGIKDSMDYKTFYAASMLVFSLINSAIDLGNEIISAKHFEFPAYYDSVFEILFKNKIIDKKTSSNLIYLVRIRNAISHRYFSITENELIKASRLLDSVLKLADITKKLADKK